MRPYLQLVVAALAAASCGALAPSDNTDARCVAYPRPRGESVPVLALRRPSRGGHQQSNVAKIIETGRRYLRGEGVHAPKLELRTTPASVGGRGLFATAACASGEVLASIPHHLVRKAPPSDDWHATLALEVLRFDRDPWVDALPQTYGGFDYLDCADVAAWVAEAAAAGNLPADRLAEGVAARRATYAARRDWIAAEAPDASADAIATACRCVLSRSAAIDGRGNHGLVPFFDFLNHGSLGSDANVELMTYGQAVRRAGDETGDEAGVLDLDDMLLVATQDIVAGAELLTAYAAAGDDDVDYRLRLLLSYGIG